MPAPFKNYIYKKVITMLEQYIVKFITLTLISGEKVKVNPIFISTIIPNPSGSKVCFTEKENFITVKETPEEIENILEKI